MAKKYAVRNIRLCTKDCLCLYVCPTGATDTEDSIIDVNKCIGCGACAEACPSGAISMVPVEYPPQQPHKEDVKQILQKIAQNKATEEVVAKGIDCKLAKALQQASRLMAEDLVRENGYMLPQSKTTNEFLQDLLKEETNEDIKAKINKLLQIVEIND